MILMINFRKMMLVAAVASAPFLLAACYHSKSTSSNQIQTGTEQQTSSHVTSGVAEGATVITLSDDGFTPGQITVKSGGKVAYTNNSGAKIQIGSDPHPTHTANTELTDGDFVLEIEPGASATVTLTKTGNWGYHDHLNPGVRGKVTVQ